MLLVIIVNYRTPALAMDCLRSLCDEFDPSVDMKVIVVDNDSRDGSADIIEQGIADAGIGAWCVVVRSPENGGFAHGNNVGLSSALNGTTSLGPIKPSFVWLLNPDTYVRPGAVRAALDFLETHREAGIAGTRIENSDGSVWLSAFHFPSLWSELDHALSFGPFTRLISDFSGLYPPSDECRPVDWVSGASLLVRYAVIEKLGFLDDGYFMYFEETDFCLAAARSGIECWQVPTSRVVHLIGQSSGITGDGARRQPKYWFDSRERYFRKNHGAAYLHVTNLLWSLLYPFGSLQRRLRGKPRQDPPYLWWDLVRYAYLVPRS